MKNSLALFENKGQVLVSSRLVAKDFGKEHFSVISTVESLIEETEGYQSPIDTPIFLKQSYIHEQNRQQYSEYLLNKRAFLLLMMRLKGNIAFIKQNEYIDEFERMESLLRERQTTDWLKTRQSGKLIRRETTDAIQKLIPYATSQGSQNARMMYLTYSKLVNKTVGIESGTRDKATVMQLMQITMLEDLITRTIQEEIANGVYYKEIYKICKAKVNQFATLTYLNAA